MFMFLLLIIISELVVSLFINKLLAYFNLNIYLFRLIEFVIEFFIIYFVIVFLYIYSPPKKMRYRDVINGAFISSLLIYLLMLIVILLNSLIGRYLQLLNLSNSLFLIISIYLLTLFVINYILILGLIINSKNYKLLIKEIW